MTRLHSLPVRNPWQSHVVCRYGGEEFLLLMPESPLAGAFERAERLRAEIKSMPSVYHRKPLRPVTLSAGVAESAASARRKSVSQAKQGGRDRVVRAQSRTGRKAV